MLILVVEDELLVAYTLEWALKDTSHQILGPADSFEAAICRLQDFRRVAPPAMFEPRSGSKLAANFACVVARAAVIAFWC
jgi:hypothetical protein